MSFFGLPWCSRFRESCFDRFVLAKVGIVSQWRRVDGDLRGFARKGAVQARHLGG